MKMVGLKGALSVWFLFLIFHRFFQSEHSFDFSSGKGVCRSVDFGILVQRRWRGAILQRCQYLSYHDRRSSKAVMMMLLMCSGDVERNPGPGTLVTKEALPRLLNLLSPVVHHWDLFAEQIKVPHYLILQIKAANPQTGPDYLYKCFTQALEWWIANHDNPVYETIIGVLDEVPAVMNRALAKDLREFLAKQRAPSQQQPASLSAIETYAHYLKFEVYLRQKFPTYGKWPLNPAKKFINLALIKKENLSQGEMDRFTRQTIRGNIDDIIEEKQPISMEMIGQPKDNILPKCILVEGAPGVGKSTFAWKLCREWSKGKLLQQYRLVVLLQLRDKRVREAKSISDLFYFYNRQIQQTVVQEVQATGGRGVLLLFEGYDELPAKLRTSKSIFLDVIKGHELPTATILVTSRPSASGPLYKKCWNFISQHVQILGFTDENVQSYLESTTSHDPSLLQGLQQYLTYYPHIRPMLYIPLNCAIVVEVYRVYKSSNSLIPKTWTDLYSSLFRSLLLRYLDDHPVHQMESWETNSFRDLPVDVYQQLCEVSRIAYEGILQDQQVIFSDLPSDFNSLGLMQCVPELYVDEGIASKSFNFLHLTLQEYMAALHLCEQPVDKQIELFEKYQFQQSLESPPSTDQSHTHFQTVLRFLAGLRKFTDYPTSAVRALLGCPISSGVVNLSLDALHWMFEARCSNVCEDLGISVVSVVLPGRLTSFDCFVLGYWVYHSKCRWEVDLGGCTIGDEAVKMLVREAIDCESKHSGHISVMNMFNNEITSTGLNELLKIPKLMKFRQLFLSNNPLGRQGAVSLLNSPLVHNLEGLSLAKTGIGVEDCQALSELLSFSSILQRIDISYNDLTSEAVEHIITGLKNHTALEELHIVQSRFNLQNCILLASLTQPPRRLNLWNCHIDDEGAIEVAKLLNQNTVTSLSLEENPISVSGASEFAKRLRHNMSLIELNLDCESIGVEGTQKLIDSLSQNRTLRTLWLPEKCKSFFNTSAAYQRVKDRIKWGTPPTLFRPFLEHKSETRISTSEPQPVTLPSSSGVVIDAESGTGEELADSSMAVSARGGVTEEMGVDSLESNLEDWFTPPTSPQDSLCSKIRRVGDTTNQLHASRLHHLHYMMLGPSRD